MASHQSHAIYKSPLALNNMAHLQTIHIKLKSRSTVKNILIWWIENIAERDVVG